MSAVETVEASVTHAPALPGVWTGRPGAHRASATGALDAWVDRMVHGEERAFGHVYRTVHPGLLRYLSALVGRCDAEDVASETWGQAVRDLGSFRGDGDGFRAWISTIGRHRALDHLRARGRRPLADVRLEDLPDRADAVDAELGALDTLSTRAAITLIASLPTDQAEAVLLRAVMGLDAVRAARVLGKRPGAVRTAAHRGLRTLHDRLAEHHSDTCGPFGADEVR